MRILVLVLFLLGFASPVHAEWREAESRHFLIYSAGSEKELLKHSVRLESVHYLLGLATGAKEQARITKALEKLAKEMGGLKGRLNNPNFAGAAPPEVVEEARGNLALREEEEAQLKAALARLAEIR